MRSMRTVAMLALLWAGVAAADCPRPEGTGSASISSRSDEERLRFLATNLGQQADASFRWTLGWGLTYGVLTIGQLAVMPAFHEVDWPDWYWGAITSALGIPLIFAASPGLLARGGDFQARARAATHEGTCALIAEGERLLIEGAKAQYDSTRWYVHATNIGVNVVLALILGFGYQRWLAAGLNFGIGAPAGEATILTTPTGLIDALSQYRHGGDKRPPLTWHLVPMGAGLGVAGRF